MVIMDKNLMHNNKNNKIRESSVFYTINTILLVIISAVCFLPFMNVLSVALSTAGFQINFKPEGFTLYNFLPCSCLRYCFVGNRYVCRCVRSLQKGFPLQKRTYGILYHRYDIQRWYGAELPCC